MVAYRLFPFVRLFLAYGLGIVFFSYVEWGTMLLVTASFVSLILHLFSSKLNFWLRHYSGVIQLFLIFFLGGLTLQVQDQRRDVKFFAQGIEDYSYQMAEGVVEEIPKKQRRSKTVIHLKKLCNTDTCRAVVGSVMAYFDTLDGPANQYKPGDLVRFVGKFSEVNKGKNPNSFDFRQYLINRKVWWQASIRPGDHELLAEFQFHAFQNAAMKVRGYCIEVFDRYLLDPDERSIASAMVLGFRNQVAQDIYQSFSETGAVHVLAVSGLHVGVICGILVFFFDRIRIKTRWFSLFRLLAILCLVWFYSFLTGNAPAVMRASIMFSMILVAKYFQQRSVTLNILGFCGFLMLLWDAKLLFQASFQFSYLALASILFFQPVVTQWWASANVFLHKVWELVSVSIAAQILVFPITILFFHKFPTYFIVSGVFAVPLALVVLKGGLGLLGISLISSAISVWVSYGLSCVIWIFIRGIDVIHKLPMSNLDGIWITKFECVLMYGFIVTVMYFYRKPHRTIFLIAACHVILLLGSLLMRLDSQRKQSKITVYDSFQGSVIDVFDGKKNFSFLSGSFSDEELIFLCKQNRDFHGINEEKNLDNDLKGQYFFKAGSFLRFSNGNTVMLSSQNAISPAVWEAVDVVILHDVKWMHELPNLIDKPVQVVLDRTVSYKARKFWMDYCENRKCQIHYTGRDGAYEHDFQTAAN